MHWRRSCPAARMLNSSQANIFFGVLMSLKRVGRLAAVVLPIVLWAACGEVYRPVVLPCSEGGIPNCPVEAPPQPSAFHSVFAVSVNQPTYPGNAMQIDVGGDSIVGETPSSDESAPNLGDNPTHAATLPNDSLVFVASAASLQPGGLDLVSSFSPASAIATTVTTTTGTTTTGGLGPISNLALPSGSLPVFLNTTQNGFIYVANFGTNSVSVINTLLNAVVNTGPVGTNPVAMAETPDALKLYVANQGSNSISDVNPVGLTSTLVSGFTGMTPVWVVARGDSQKVYVLTQGDGQLVTIDTLTDTVVSSSPVGAGVNFVFYDPNLNRLYVTNPVTDTLYIFSVFGGPNDTPSLLKQISFAAGSGPCPSGCSPASVTGLPDGESFYVATYETETSCPDPFIGASSPCVIPRLSVFDAYNLTFTTTLTLLTNPPFAADLSTNKYQYAVPPVATCAPALPPATYSPNTTRFRVFTTSSVDSSRVYVSMCDAGAIAVINTLDNNVNDPASTSSPANTVITDLPAPFSHGAIQANGEPPNQNPIFLLTGQ
jgi:YVTN family beta-propeller protein